MKDQCHLYEKTGAWVTFTKSKGWYHVRLYSPTDVLVDKMQHDDRTEALETLRDFKARARNWK